MGLLAPNSQVRPCTAFISQRDPIPLIRLPHNQKVGAILFENKTRAFRVTFLSHCANDYELPPGHRTDLGHGVYESSQRTFGIDRAPAVQIFIWPVTLPPYWYLSRHGIDVTQQDDLSRAVSHKSDRVARTIDERLTK